MRGVFGGVLQGVLEGGLPVVVVGWSAGVPSAAGIPISYRRASPLSKHGYEEEQKPLA